MGLGMAVINASVMVFDPLSLHGGLEPSSWRPRPDPARTPSRTQADLMYFMGSSD
jgi:hypothetical protein